MKTSIISVIAVAAICASTARADIELFEVRWSGLPHGNAASATAIVGIDTAAIPNPGIYLDLATQPAWLSSVTLTVTGAITGNGTFTLADFSGLSWHTGGATLNFDLQLIGQPTPGSPWGTIGAPTAFGSGDFNLFDAAGGLAAPSGLTPFQMRVGVTGEVIDMTSFAPVPEPTTYALLAVGCFGLLALRRRNVHR